MEVRRISDAVQTRDAGYDYDVATSRQQGGGGAETEFLYLVVDAQVLFYICIRYRKIGFRLVVVIV